MQFPRSFRYERFRLYVVVNILNYIKLFLISLITIDLHQSSQYYGLIKAKFYLLYSRMLTFTFTTSAKILHRKILFEIFNLIIYMTIFSAYFPFEWKGPYSRLFRFRLSTSQAKPTRKYEPYLSPSAIKLSFLCFMSNGHSYFCSLNF